MDSVSRDFAQMLVGVLVPIAFFMLIAVIVIVPLYLRSLERQKMVDAVRVALDKGHPLPPEVVEVLGARNAASSPSQDLRRGATLIAVALGLVVLGLVIGADEGRLLHPLIGVAAIPGFIGLALIAIYLLQRPRD